MRVNDFFVSISLDSMSHLLNVAVLYSTMAISYAKDCSGLTIQLHFGPVIPSPAPLPACHLAPSCHCSLGILIIATLPFIFASFASCILCYRHMPRPTLVRRPLPTPVLHPPPIHIHPPPVPCAIYPANARDHHRIKLLLPNSQPRRCKLKRNYPL